MRARVLVRRDFRAPPQGRFDFAGGHAHEAGWRGLPTQGRPEFRGAEFDGAAVTRAVHRAAGSPGQRQCQHR